MRAPVVVKGLIFVHRWMGVALSTLFLLWFASGVVMMYWDFPSVRPEGRLEHAPALDASRVHISAAEAFDTLHSSQPPAQIRLNVFDGRPVYRFRLGRNERIVYADTGVEQAGADPAMAARVASAWTGQALATAIVESMQEVDQWTVQGSLRNTRPLWKYSWPNGEQVYVSGTTGDVLQYTTSRSRFWAYLGAIPHWLYFTPLRKHQPEWSRFVIVTSGAGTIAALLGIVIGAWMYSPSRRYRHNGAPASIPYRGQKRWHAVLGLIFGLGAVTWAFSGMLSMDPFPTRSGGTPRADRGADVVRALHGRVQLAAFQAKSPRDALLLLSQLKVKELELTTIAQEPVYLATIARGETWMVPVRGDPTREAGAGRVIAILRRFLDPASIAELRLLEDYDAYYLDRHRERPFP
ncbi:MAG TPA: PepSY domain-containing protein, partial [Bryobacteraceae bacterium]